MVLRTPSRDTFAVLGDKVPLFYSSFVEGLVYFLTGFAGAFLSALPIAICFGLASNLYKSLINLGTQVRTAIHIDNGDLSSNGR